MSCIGGKTLGAAALVVCPCELDGTGERILSRFSTIRKISGKFMILLVTPSARENLLNDIYQFLNVIMLTNTSFIDLCS